MLIKENVHFGRHGSVAFFLIAGKPFKTFYYYYDKSLDFLNIPICPINLYKCIYLNQNTNIKTYTLDIRKTVS